MAIRNAGRLPIARVSGTQTKAPIPMNSVGADTRVSREKGFVSCVMLMTTSTILRDIITAGENSCANGLNIILAPSTRTRLTTTKSISEMNAAERLVLLQLSGSRGELVGIGRLSICPEEEMR